MRPPVSPVRRLHCGAGASARPSDVEKIACARSAIRVLALLSLLVTSQRVWAHRRLTEIRLMKTLQTVFALLLVSGLAPAQDYTISTIAGIPGVQGWFGDGAVATSGQLDKPLRVAVDR